MSKKDLDIKSSVTPTADAPVVLLGVKELAKQKLHQMMKEESRLVKGVFQCFETPGDTVKVVVKKYPNEKQGGIPHFEKTMTDGETYEIPLYVARHLNGCDVTANAFTGGEGRNTNIGTCSYPRHGFVLPSRGAEPRLGASGTGPYGDTVVPVATVGIVKRVKRFGFQSMEFAAEASA